VSVQKTDPVTCTVDTPEVRFRELNGQIHWTVTGISANAFQPVARFDTIDPFVSSGTPTNYTVNMSVGFTTPTEVRACGLDDCPFAYTVKVAGVACGPPTGYIGVHVTR